MSVSFFTNEYHIEESEQFPCNWLFMETQQPAEILRDLCQLTVCMDIPLWKSSKGRTAYTTKVW